MGYFYGTENFNPGFAGNSIWPMVNIWNGSGSKRMVLRALAAYFSDFDAGGGWNGTLVRSSTTGTPGKTATVAAANERDQASVPPTGFTVLGNYANGNQPTWGADSLHTFQLLPTVSGTNSGAGTRGEWPRGIDIPPGTGIILLARVATTATFGTDALAVSWEVED